MLGIEVFIDKITVAKTQMLSVGEQLRLSTVMMLQLA
jgi:hypothetical protein